MKLSIVLIAVVAVACGKGKEKDGGGGGGAAGGGDKAEASCSAAAAAYVKLLSKSDGYYIGSVKATPEQTKAATAIIEADCGAWSAESKNCVAATTDAMKIGKCWKASETLRIAELLPTFEKAEQEKAKAAGSAAP